ncbi:enoyl-CoA hydratase-related protein [Arthrobacter sp. efr-133-TYG-118]|uniref:enoyl-CoA hydratase-related protein n=1 Tax=Arthrobacter sp. efr-133-TYG-118 TaxID=3040279 RepID=UPI00254AC977|nr:enoyl-CoA hydratase-related protein [Arthrobacter sp. efr-133-TYG-118]
MTYEQILVDVRDSIATITLNRPEQRNGYTSTRADELGTAFRAANVDPEVRVVIAASGKDFEAPPPGPVERPPLGPVESPQRTYLGT